MSDACSPPAIETALAIALEAHAGQRDKAGAPYILHPLRVMLAMEGEVEQVAALLHDVVEDSNWTLEALRQRGIPEEATVAIEALTKRPEESYEAFIARAGANPIARRVKIADLEDNMDIRRLSVLGVEEMKRLQRYRRAWELLTML